MDKKALRDLGLTGNETEVYLTLLRKGSITVNDIAEGSGLHRQAVYDALDRLLEKGFASFVIMNNKKHFQGIDPHKVMDYIKAKERAFLSILPELTSITQSPEEDTSIEVFKGKGIARSVFQDIIKSLQKRPGEVLISGVEEQRFLEEDHIALEQHLQQIRKLHSREKILIREGDLVRVSGTQTNYRWTPQASFNPTPMYVYNNNLTIIIWGNPNYAIKIRNANLADAYRKQFNMIWKGSRLIPKAGKGIINGTAGLWPEFKGTGQSYQRRIRKS